MGFSTLLQGRASHEALLSRQDSEIRLLDTIKRCLSQKVKCDKEYAVQLSAVAQQGLKPDRTDELQGSHITKAWRSVMEDWEHMAKQLKSNAELLESVCQDKLLHLLQDKRKARKLYQEEHSKISSQFNQLSEDVSRKKTEYQKHLDYYKMLRSRFEEHYIKSGRGGRKLDDVRDKYQKACRKLHLAHNEYVLLINEATEVEKDIRTILLPNLLENQQSVQEGFITTWKSILQEASQYGDFTSEKFCEIQRRVDSNLQNVNPAEEYRDFTEKHKTTPTTPVIFQFDKTLSEDKDTLGKLQPNTLAVDNLTVDWLRTRLNELETNVKECQDKQSKLSLENGSVTNNGHTIIQSNILGHGISVINGLNKDCTKQSKELTSLKCQERQMLKLADIIKSALNDVGCEELPSGCDDLSVDQSFIDNSVVNADQPEGAASYLIQKGVEVISLLRSPFKNRKSAPISGKSSTQSARVNSSRCRGGSVSRSISLLGSMVNSSLPCIYEPCANDPCLLNDATNNIYAEVDYFSIAKRPHQSAQELPLHAFTPQSPSLIGSNALLNMIHYDFPNRNRRRDSLNTRFCLSLSNINNKLVDSGENILSVRSLVDLKQIRVVIPSNLLSNNPGYVHLKPIVDNRNRSESNCPFESVQDVEWEEISLPEEGSLNIEHGIYCNPESDSAACFHESGIFEEIRSPDDTAPTNLHKSHSEITLTHKDYVLMNKTHGKGVLKWLTPVSNKFKQNLQFQLNGWKFLRIPTQTITVKAGSSWETQGTAIHPNCQYCGMEQPKVKTNNTENKWKFLNFSNTKKTIDNQHVVLFDNSLTNKLPSLYVCDHCLDADYTAFGSLTRVHSKRDNSKVLYMNLSTNRPLYEEEWFHGVLPREEVVRLLKNDGDFLVRETIRNEESQIVLSVCWNGHKHFIVQTTAEGHYRFEGPAFPSIQELIMHQNLSELPVTGRSGAILKRPVLRERWELSNDDVILLDKIGRGNFGDVYKARLKSSKKEVAVKTCRMTLPDEQKRKFLQEGRILKQYDHPNIVKLIGICVQKQPIMIVMELVPGGSLLNFLRKNAGSLTTKQLMGMCRDAAAGMRYLESKNCIHRDLAARNCLIGYENIVKISDFGMSREEEEYIVSDGMKQIPIKWTAPEALNFGKYTSLCDVWSYGILIWEIFSKGDTPYSGMSNSRARERIDGGYRMPAPENTPQEIHRLMLKCWSYEAETRPHFDEIYTIVDALQNREI